MDDLISRQAAIDALGKAPKYKQKIIKTYAEGRNDQWFDDVAALVKLPSAQPQSTMGQANEAAQSTNDCISRQAAIEGINKLMEIHFDRKIVLKKARDVVEQLPPAQPEIIRCKDCKYRMPYDWMFSETWQSQNMDDYPDDEIGCLCCDMGGMKADDYCSRAERRTDG